MTKRLGDGFYEQRLIREQVAQLTGYRYLGGAHDDQSQYAALMDAGVTFAKAYQLRPGIALSAAQMAQLTSDIVWLVEQTVTLADGSSQRVLVPQVYVRVKPGDIDGSGALLSADTLRIQNEAGQGDVVNSGTLAGRSLVAMTADNVHNLGGRITGASVGVNARTDLANIGGTIEAQNAAVLTAGRDIRIASTTQTAVGPQGSATALDRLAAVYVSNPGGTLVARAGQDVQLGGAMLSNTGEGGMTSVQAGRDIQLDTLKTRSNQDTTWNAKNYQRTTESAEVGSTIAANGTTVRNAGRDIAIRQGTVDAGTGLLSVQAGHDITIAAGQNTQTYEEARHRKTSGFMSSTTRTTRDKLAYTGAEASSLGGSTVTAVAGHDLSVHGSNVVSDRGTTLVAGNDLAITAATNTSVDSHFTEKKTSGMFSSGGFGVTFGTQQQSTNQKGTTTTAAASTIGSTQGHVILSAGQTYTQRGSDVLAPAGDVSISASKVDILEARETNNSQTETKFKQSGLTLALTSPIISAIETAQQMGQAASRTSSTRMQVLAAANVGMGVNNAVNAVKAGQGTTINGENNQIATGNKNLDGTAETRDATAAEKAGGINLSISIGASSSQSKSTQSSDSARGSTVAAGGNISISASGAGADSDLLIQGAKIKAGNSVSLHADDAIELLAAKSTAEQHSTNSNKSGSIGISIGTSGFGVTVSASKGRGKADGNDVTWTNTEVGAGQAVHMSSGGDTTLKGAVVKADTVQADVGGNLAIESLQDTSTYASKQQSFSASVTMGAGASGSFSASNSRVNSDFASVEQQSGIQAGDGGFQVNVKGNTDLAGAAITSTQAAIDARRNHLQTATLTTHDIENHASVNASSSGLSLGTDMAIQGSYGLVKGLLGNAINNGSASGSEVGATRTTVSAGVVTITDEAGQLTATGQTAEQAVAALNRQSDGVHTPVQRQDAHAMEQDAQAQQAIKNLAFKSFTVYTDDAYKTMFKTDAKYYRITCSATQSECMNYPDKVRLEVIDADTARREGKILAANGILNDAPRAGQLAYQNASLDEFEQKPNSIVLMHIAPAQTTLGEILVAGYEKALASTLGYSNADIGYADLLESRGQQATISMGHSRGTIVQSNAFDILAERGYGSEGLTVEGVGIAVATQRFFDSAERVIVQKPNESRVSATYMANDAISVIAAGNPGDAWAAIKEFWNVMFSSNSAHSCYGTGAKDCVTIANPMAGGPVPAGQQPDYVKLYRQGQLVTPQDKP